MKILQRVLFIGLFVLISANVRAGDIIVMGYGETNVVPDTLSFNVYVKEKGPLVSKLYASVNQKVEQVLRVLAKEKIASENIQSMELQVQPWIEFENRNRIQKGFELARHIEVTLTDTSRLSFILDYIFRVGNLEIGNFTLGTSQRAEFYQQALKQAMQNAKDKAGLLATNGGIKLGGITGIKEMGASVVHPMNEMKTMSNSGAGDFVPGNIAISAQVEVSFSVNN